MIFVSIISNRRIKLKKFMNLFGDSQIVLHLDQNFVDEENYLIVNV